MIVTEPDLTLLKLLGRHPPLQRELAKAAIVPARKVPPDVVTMNSTVRYRDETAGVHRAVKIVYPHAADGRRRVSVLSPLGTALLGKSVGQAIDWRFPASNPRRLRLERVIHQPERNHVRRMRKDEIDFPADFQRMLVSRALPGRGRAWPER